MVSQKQITILQIVPELETGGAELSTIEMAEAIASAGARALVASAGGRQENKLAEVGGELLRLPMSTKNPLKILSNAKAIEKIIQEQNVALVHIRSRAPGWSGYLAAKRSKTPLVGTYHGAYGNKEPFKNLYNRVMTRGVITIANSNYVAELVRRQHPQTAKDIRVIYRGVDFSKYNIESIPADRVRALSSKWNIQESDTVLLLAARLSPIKGHLQVIEAVRMLRDRQPELYKNACLKVIFAGDAQGREAYVEKMDKAILEAQLEKTILRVGHCDDMPAAFLRADLSLSASTVPETFGRTGIEAQAVECPAIATTLGAPKETILSREKVGSDQMTGWLVVPNDPEALCDSFVEFLNQREEERQAMGKRASAHVRQIFSKENMQIQTLRVYDEILGTDLASKFNSEL